MKVETLNQKTKLFEKFFEVRWADCDANNHMRHTAYSDMASHSRVCFLQSIGVDAEWLQANNLGPVLFTDEINYKQEVHLGETVRVTVEVGESTGSNKSVQLIQHLYNESGELAAINKAVSGWMDLSARKIVHLPEQLYSRYPRVLPKNTLDSATA